MGSEITEVKMAGLMSMFTNNKDDAKTILKQKKFSEGTLRYQRYKQAKECMDNGEDPRKAVKLQDDTSFEDWLAVYVVDFTNRINLFYSLIEEECTPDSCPKM